MITFTKEQLLDALEIIDSAFEAYIDGKDEYEIYAFIEDTKLPNLLKYAIIARVGERIGRAVREQKKVNDMGYQ